ncbi:MAG: hypothetical protein AAFY60_00360 [Myxococcota bacterium]
MSTALVLAFVLGAPEVSLSIPDLLPDETRSALREAATVDGAKTHASDGLSVAGSCGLHVHIEVNQSKKRIELTAHIDSGTGEHSQTVPLLSAKVPSGGTPRFKARRVDRAGLRLRDAIREALDTLQCANDEAPEQPSPAAAPPQALTPQPTREPVVERTLNLGPRDKETEPVVRLAASLAIGERSFAYRDFLYGERRDVQLSLTPLAHLSAALAEPGPWVAGLDFTAALPTTEVSVQDTESLTLGTRWLTLAAKLGARLELSRSWSASAVAVGRYESFGFVGELEDTVANRLPSLTHLAIGGGAELAYRSELLRGRLAAQGLYSLAFGDFIETQFPNASGFGVSTQGSLLIAMDSSTAVGVRTEMVRYGLSLAPEVGATTVAGGAVDQAWNAGLLLEIEL